MVDQDFDRVAVDDVVDIRFLKVGRSQAVGQRQRGVDLRVDGALGGLARELVDGVERAGDGGHGRQEQEHEDPGRHLPAPEGKAAGLHANNW